MCKTPGKESRNEGESAKGYVANFLRSVVKLFWIEHTLGTKVGNEYVRGVSGGEKKRVSIAEAMITKASIQCWDNSTRGLDASTALEYVESLRSLTNMAHISTAVALYQAGESLYDCFDKVILLDQGRCAYFGPTEAAVQYFQTLGFERPDRWTSADFLTSVTDKHERHIREGEQHQRNLAEIEEFEREAAVQVEERHKAQAKATRKKNYTIPFSKQVMACTHRQFLVMVGDKQSLGGKWGGILFQALIVGSLFYELPDTAAGVFPRGGLIFFILPVPAYAIAQTAVDVPLVFVQVVIFDIVVYFMAHLSRTASQFFISLQTVLYSFAAGTCYWAAWFWPPHFSYSSYTSASVWLFIMLFEVFYVSFGQAIASFAPNELLASLLVPLIFLFVLLEILDVLAHAVQVSSGRLARPRLHGVPVKCDDSEFAQFAAPPGETCESYVGPYITQAGGYVTTLDSGLCGFCQYANGDAFGASFNVHYRHVWRDYGIFWAFCVFNLAVVFICSWLCLQGGKKIKGALSPAARRERKALKKRQGGQEG
ncbi:hypothetical protein LTR65_004971 [Meristemomyces frigidus]